jgi:4-amino-4-deoxy-L-arabinose transferase-like glycosyltransferase
MELTGRAPARLEYLDRMAALTAAPESGFRFDRDARGLALVVALVVGVLALFVGKAFTIDDPLALWLAEHLMSQPFDFFGFDVNWYSSVMPMYEVTRNPPLVGYYIAGAASLFGLREVALHVAFLVPAAGVAACTWWLARRFCEAPLAAALIGLLTPVFLVSSTNVMSDTLMLAFWCASLACWIHGLDSGRFGWLLAGASLAGVAALSKYFAIALLPLLVVYALLRERRLGPWLLALVIPCALIVAYEGLTRSMYGVGLVMDAIGFVDAYKQERGPGWLHQAFIGLVFAGGCLVSAIFLAPFLWTRAVLVTGCLLYVAGATFWGDVAPWVAVEFPSHTETSWLLVGQVLLLALGGASALGLAAADFWRRRDADAALLALWLVGTFVFAAFVNWVNNGRSNLPMAPVFGILAVRQLASRARKIEPLGFALHRRHWIALVPAVAVALAVTWADYRWANQVRASAERVVDVYAGEDRTVYFLGNWGFQWYMEAGGATAMDVSQHRVQPGDLLILASNNTNFRIPPHGTVTLVERTEFLEPDWVRTMSIGMGAGFYASNTGPMPFAFGTAFPDVIRVLEAVREFGFREAPW